VAVRKDSAVAQLVRPLGRMKTLKMLPMLVCTALIAGCGSVSPKIDHVAIAKRLADGTYQVDLRYTETSSGGPCFNSSFFKSTTSHSHDSLYLKSLEGTMSADQITVRVGGQGVESWKIEDLRGVVVFTNNTMSVQLEQPNVLRSGAVRGFAPYRLNGTYQVTNASPSTTLEPTPTAH
jgi:hypothetical protein